MKKIKQAICLLLTLVLSAAAFAIPKPTENTKTLLYGMTDVLIDFEEVFDGRSSYHQVENVKLTFQNTSSLKEYTLSSNSRGEIIKAKLPYGNYRLVKISLNFYYEDQNWSIWLAPQEEFTNYYFDIKNGVTNLGKVALKYNTATESGSLIFGKGFQFVYKLFKQQYPTSLWLENDWTNTDGSRIEK